MTPDESRVLTAACVALCHHPEYTPGCDACDIRHEAVLEHFAALLADARRET